MHGAQILDKWRTCPLIGGSRQRRRTGRTLSEENTKTGARRLLILGGARSGKSALAEQLAGAHASRVYIATGAAGDKEMQERIALHRARRGPAWRTVEEPLDLAGALAGNDAEGAYLLVDCITLWLSNLMAAEGDVEAAVEELAGTLADLRGTVALVSNEVGLGIVPDNALARRFRDIAGRANQRLAVACDQVVLVAAGLPLVLKGPPLNG